MTQTSMMAMALPIDALILIVANKTLKYQEKNIVRRLLKGRNGVDFSKSNLTSL